MLAASATRPNLYLVIPDQQLSNTIISNLTDDYIINAFNSVEALLSSASGETSALILCHEIVLEQQSIVLETIKADFLGARILVIGVGRPIELQISAIKNGARGYRRMAVQFRRHFRCQSIDCQLDHRPNRPRPII